MGTEVTEASKCICLYALGASFAPLRALTAAAFISASAALFEELAFRGVLQGLLQVLLGHLLPARAAIGVALVVQALLFGVLHSYTPSPSYLLAASIAALALGWAFASTGNMFVPVLMHFIFDFVSFSVCHVQVTCSGEQAQRRLMRSDSPIAVALAASMSSPLLTS